MHTFSLFRCFTSLRADFDDQATTNLYVANLAPDVTEEMVMSEFGKFGAIGMWRERVSHLAHILLLALFFFMSRSLPHLLLLQLAGCVFVYLEGSEHKPRFRQAL